MCEQLKPNLESKSYTPGRSLDYHLPRRRRQEQVGTEQMITWTGLEFWFPPPSTSSCWDPSARSRPLVSIDIWADAWDSSGNKNQNSRCGAWGGRLKHRKPESLVHSDAHLHQLDAEWWSKGSSSGDPKFLAAPATFFLTKFLCSDTCSSDSMAEFVFNWPQHCGLQILY